MNTFKCFNKSFTFTDKSKRKKKVNKVEEDETKMKHKRKLNENDDEEADECDIKPDIDNLDESDSNDDLKPIKTEKRHGSKQGKRELNHISDDEGKDVKASTSTKRQPKRKLNNIDDDIKPDIKKLKPSTSTTYTSADTNSEHNKQLWEEYELLAENKNLSIKVSRGLIHLFEEGNTIPFIARYRTNLTNNLNADQLRDIKDEYDKICALKARSQTVLKNVEKSGNLNQLLQQSILSARTAEELEHIYAPYKPGTKRSLAERAKALGLETAALDLLNNSRSVNLEMFVDNKNKELATIHDVEKGIMHIIASVIATDTDVLSLLRNLRAETNFSIECKKSNAKKESSAPKGAKTAKDKLTNKSKVKNVNEENFANYFDYRITQKYIKPHQVLAINRGEALKVLSVKVVVPDFLCKRYSYFCTSKWINKGYFNQNRKRIMELAIKDAYSRLIQPYIIREVRSELKSKAEKASYEVFCTNLKNLLLMPPFKGRKILGIDPGYTNGCKLAVISETGSILTTAVIYPNTNKSRRDVDTLKDMLKNHNCSFIALGNGTACRETEAWLTDLLHNNIFAPLDVTYTIVNENGASIYSCSAEAKKEFPSMEPNLISAVSLARRVQEPLAELVKVEPRHLGVGMYQHDLPKKQLEQALDEVVMECVSFVGVDLNTASQCLLKHIAGLTEKRATQILDYREKKGLFTSRKELMEVKGIGSKVFEQCAGFLRVCPTTSSQSNEFYKSSSTNRLDCTYIHPESYDTALDLLKKLKLKLNDIGQPGFINVVKSKMTSLNVEELGNSLNCSEETVNLILDALSKPLNFDLRNDSNQKPLFKKGLTSIHNLNVGCVLTGSITNVTHFGCFVDVGVGQDGLIHQSNLNGFHLQLGDRVEVKVVNLEIDRKRIGLKALNKM